MKLIGKLWLLFFVAVVLMGVVQFSPSNIHTDIRALLPTSTDSASADKILAHSPRHLGLGRLQNNRKGRRRRKHNHADASSRGTASLSAFRSF